MSPRGPRMRAIRPTLAIWSGVAIAASKSRKPSWTVCDQIVAADPVGAGGFRLGGLVAGGEDDDSGGLPGAVRQIDRAPHHLVRLAGVDAESQGDLDRAVELGR